VLSHEIASTLRINPSQMDRTLALDVTNNLRHSIFRWDRDHHVIIIGHQMPLFDPALLLGGKLPENLTEVTPQISIQSWLRLFGQFPADFKWNSAGVC